MADTSWWEEIVAVAAAPIAFPILTLEQALEGSASNTSDSNTVTDNPAGDSGSGNTNPATGQPQKTFTQKAREILGLSDGSPGGTSTLQTIENLLFWGAILGSVMLVFWVAIQIKIALR